MAKKEEQIIETTQQVGGQVYPIPDFDDVNVRTSPGVEQIAGGQLDTPLLPPEQVEIPYDSAVVEVTKTYEGDSTPPYDDEQAISGKRSDVKYDTNNDPILAETPNVQLDSRDRVPEGNVVAKPFPPRHDQAGYLADSGDPVLVVTGQNRKNWYLSDEMPFVAEVTAAAAGVATVKQKSLSGNPSSGVATLADLLDKDGSLVTYTNVKILKANANYSDFAVGDTVWVQKRGRYYFATGAPEGLPAGTVNARIGHDGDNWQAIRSGVAKIVSNDGSGDYTIAEQIWDPDLGTPAWVPAGYTVTGDGGGPDGSPNGDYVRGGTYGGQVYYEPAGAAFAIWSSDGGTSWFISVAPNDVGAGKWGRVPYIEGIYNPVAPYTGNPVVAATTLSARDISENANGVAGDYVTFWQQEDDNGDTEAVIHLTASLPPTIDGFTKDFWFHITGDMAWTTVHGLDYGSRFIDAAGVWDSGAPALDGSFNEDDIDVLDVDDANWVSMVNAQGLQKYVGGNTNNDYELIRFVGTNGHALGDFKLRTQSVTGNLQALSENYTGTQYNVRVRLRVGQQLAVADDTNIPV